MVHQKRMIVLLAMLILPSCSDFLNRKREQTPTISAQERRVFGKNPFPEGYDPNQGEFAEEKMIANIGLNVIAPRVTQLRLESELLLSDIDLLVGRLKGGRSVHNELLSAKASWRKVMLSFHFLEAVPVGPLGDRDLGLKDQMYSWPFVNVCGIDHEVVSFSGDAVLPVPSLFTVKGLLSMEYLLYEEEFGTSCNARNPKNARVVAWTQKPVAEKFVDRMRYLKVLAEDFLVNAKRLEEAWSPRGENFTKSMVDGSRYPRIGEATTALSDALFSIEVLKDKRLGKPLGLHKDCLSPEGRCVDDIEHKWSGLSLEAIEAQMDGIEAAFFGRSPLGDGFGFDDFLKVMRHGAVAERFQQLFSTWNESYRALAPLGTLEEQVLALDPAKCRSTLVGEAAVPVCVLFRETRQLSTKMKTEFLVALSLRAPPSTQGDND